MSDTDIEALCEQCNNLVSGVYKTSCKTGEGVEDMFIDIARQLSRGSNRYSCDMTDALFQRFISESIVSPQYYVD